MLEAVDLVHTTVLIALDLATAFDIQDHSILLLKLESFFVVTGSALRWVRLYLIDRISFVKVISLTILCNTDQGQGHSYYYCEYLEIQERCISTFVKIYTSKCDLYCINAKLFDQFFGFINMSQISIPLPIQYSFPTIPNPEVYSNHVRLKLTTPF